MPRSCRGWVSMTSIVISRDLHLQRTTDTVNRLFFHAHAYGTSGYHDYTPCYLSERMSMPTPAAMKTNTLQIALFHSDTPKTKRSAQLSALPSTHLGSSRSGSVPKQPKPSSSHCCNQIISVHPPILEQVSDGAVAPNQKRWRQRAFVAPKPPSSNGIEVQAMLKLKRRCSADEEHPHQHSSKTQSKRLNRSAAAEAGIMSGALERPGASLADAGAGSAAGSGGGGAGVAGGLTGL